MNEDSGNRCFTCAVCGEVFEKGWTKDEAIEELHELFGDVSLEECSMLCDDCFEPIYRKRRLEIMLSVDDKASVVLEQVARRLK